MTPEGYPPPHHLLTDLGMEAEVVSPTEVHLRIEVTPHLLGPDGGVRAGVLATVVDVVGGSVALRAVGPDWMATADLVVEMVRPARGPWIEARASLLRRGRTTLVVEALVFDADDAAASVDPASVDPASVDPASVDPSPVAWASMTFAILAGRAADVAEEPASVDATPEQPSRWAFRGEGLDQPVLDALGIEVIDASAGRLSMPALPYHRNSFGAVQGGAMALLAEAAGAEAIRAARGSDTRPVAVSGLQIAYLALGREGPIVSRARVLDPGTGLRSSAVVELADSGSDGRVTTLVNVSAQGVRADDAATPADAGALSR